MTEKILDYLKRRKFIEIYADVNLKYGGLFYRIKDTRALRITDLDPEADGCIVETLHVCWPDDPSVMANALRSIGIRDNSLDALSEDEKLLVRVDALVSFGATLLITAAVARGDRHTNMGRYESEFDPCGMNRSPSANFGEQGLYNAVVDALCWETRRR